MPMSEPKSVELVQRLMAALGLPSNTERFVIDIRADEVVRVYVVSFPEPADFVRVCEAFETVSVKSVEIDPLNFEVVMVRHGEAPNQD